MSASFDPPAKPATARFTSIDGLRGVLALSVMGDHFATQLGSKALYWPACFAVYAFFAMSGYVLTAGYNGDYGAFLVKRFVRLWPVYALCLALGFAAAGIAPNWPQFLWWPNFASVPLPKINPPIWSLLVEVWTMPFMPLIVWVSRGSIWRLLCAIAVIELAGLVDRNALFGLYFVFGAYCSRFPFRLSLLDGRLLQGLGRISYSLYLVHWPILAFAMRHFGAMGLVLSVPVAIAASVAVCLWVDEPSIRLSRYLARRTRQYVTAPLMRRLAGLAPGRGALGLQSGTSPS